MQVYLIDHFKRKIFLFFSLFFPLVLMIGCQNIKYSNGEKVDDVASFVVKNGDQDQKRKYRAIIFDIGGVLLSEPYMRAKIMVLLKKIFASLFNGTLIYVIRHYKQEMECLFHPKLFEIWDSLGLGLSESKVAEQLIEGMKKSLAKEKLDVVTKEDLISSFQYVRRYTNIIPKGMYMLKAVRARGYKVYLLSNISREDHEYYMQQEDLSKPFEFADGGIMSYEVEAIKPQPEIYKILLQEYNLKPEECLFIDNRRQMIEGANAVGIDGIVCLDHDRAIQKLKELGIL